MQALGNTLSQVRGRPVDVVLFLNRLDEFRVDASDIQVRAEARPAEALTAVWSERHALNAARRKHVRCCSITALLSAPCSV